jgi:leader peptidase (prepilin peptidase)/N-methyltransferase
MFSWDGLSFATAYPHVHGFLVSVAGFIAGGGIVWLVRVIGAFVLRREAMGFGDVVLMAMIGSVLGWQPVLVVFLLSILLALVFMALPLLILRRNGFPFGPWLSLGAVTLLLIWRLIWPRFLPFFDLGPLSLAMAGLLLLMTPVGAWMIHQVFFWLGLVPAVEVGLREDDGIPMIYPGERSDPAAGLWDRSMWSGVRSGQGLSAVHRWRHGGRD